MEPECKTLFCTHCWLKIAVITKTFLLSESRWGKCTSPVAASPLALNVDMHNFSLTMMAWNDVLFQGWHERGCCLDWQVGALLSQASVRGAGWLWPRWRDVFFSAQWALWLDSVRSFHVDSSPLSSGSIVAPARRASPHPRWLISTRVFLSPRVEKQTGALLIPRAFQSPRAHSWGHSALQVLWGNVGRERWVFSLVAAVYEGGWAVCQHSKSCCQGNDVYNCPSVC